jgi:hypothetical protein
MIARFMIDPSVAPKGELRISRRISGSGST